VRVRREELFELALCAERRCAAQCITQPCRECHCPWTLVPRHVAQDRRDAALEGFLQWRGVWHYAAIPYEPLVREPFPRLRER